MLALRLLGGASIEGESGPLTGPVAQRHRIALLALLARAHPGGLGRDKLIARLWPERDAEHARNLLRQAVHAWRKVLGEDGILSIGDELRLGSAPLRVDVIEFGEAMGAGDYEGTLPLYRGPFLDGFFLPEAIEFERWVEGERAALRADYRTALEALARAAAATGDVRAAAVHWRRLAADDPCSTKVALELMQALEAAGERAEAIRHARLHAQLLEQELGAGPSPAVVSLAERMRADAREAPEVEPASPPDPRPSAKSRRSDPAGRDLRRELRRHDPGSPRSRRRSTRVARLTAVAVIASLAGSYLGSRNGGPAVTADPLAAASPAAKEAPFQRERVPETEAVSIAVLAFDDLSPQGDKEWFADGIAEEVVNALAGVEGLRVSAISSSFELRERPVAVRRVADTLGVDLLLDGSVRRGGDSVWVTARLVDPHSGLHRWKGTYGQTATAANLRSIQNRVARDIAAALALEFHAVPGTVASFPTDEVYETYLEGRFHLRRFQSGATREPADVLRSADYFREVVDRRPDWAPGWAALGEAYSWGAFIGFESAKHHAEAKRALERALSLDPDHAQANATLAYVLHRWDRDYEAAEARFQRAFQLDIEQYWHCGYSLFLLWAGRYDEAIEATRRSVSHDPLYLHLKTLLSTSYRCAGRFEEAIQVASLTLDLEPWAVVASRDRVLALDGSGRTAEALAVLEEANLPDDYRDMLRALLLARAGRRADAQALLARTDVESASEWSFAHFGSRQITVPALHAAVLVALDRPDEAVEMLQQVMEHEPEALLYDRCYPELRQLEGDPRYRELLRSTGVPGW